MRFTINRRALNRAVNIIQRSVTKSPTFPILTCTLIELDSNGLSLTSSNGILSIRHLVPREANNEILISNIEVGSILIKSELLMELVRKLDVSEFVTFEVFDETIVKIESDNFSATIKGINADEYTNINFDEDGTSFTMDARKFIEVVDQTNFAVSIKDKAPLNSIHFDIAGGTLEATATDTAKLSRKTISISGNTTAVFNLAGKTAEVIARMAENETDISICVNKTNALFIFGDTKVCSQLTAAEYPNTKNIRMGQSDFRLEVGTNQLIAAIERISPLSSENRVIRFMMKQDEVKVTSKDDLLGSAVEKLSNFYYDCEPLEVSCGFNNIVSALRALRCEEVVLEFGGEMRPFKVTNPNDQSILVMITPVRN